MWSYFQLSFLIEMNLVKLRVIVLELRKKMATLTKRCGYRNANNTVLFHRIVYISCFSFIYFLSFFPFFMMFLVLKIIICTNWCLISVARCTTCNISSRRKETLWSWSYYSLQSSPQMLSIRIPLMADVYSIQHYIIKFVSDFMQVDVCTFVLFLFDQYVVCSSSIYGLRLPLWYLQTLPTSMTADIDLSFDNNYNIYQLWINISNFVRYTIQLPLCLVDSVPVIN